jgi:hypothetical protein
LTRRSWLPEPLRRVRQDHAVVDGCVEHAAERGVNDADPVPRESGDELLGRSALIPGEGDGPSPARGPGSDGARTCPCSLRVCAI